MKKYDVIVIGSGSGMEIIDRALSQNLKVALVDKGPLGGTCLNLGCIPSKILIYPADVIAKIQESKKLGIDALIKNIDFNAIMNRMRRIIETDKNNMKKGLVQVKGLDYYDGIGFFVDDYTIQVSQEKIKGDKIFIGTGTAPLIPKIKGVENADYLTNESVLDSQKPPKSMVIIGGGYIAAEYAHFFAAMGTKVTILQRNQRLVPNEEPEISELLKKEMQKRMDVFTNIEAVEIIKQNNKKIVIGKDKKTGKEIKYAAEEVMIAAGRKSNADLLKVENTGIEIDQRGYIKVNEYLETTKKNIWAFGDANGKFLFKHVANEEALLAWHNSLQQHKVKMDYWAAPHAIFSHPQIAGVGLTEDQAIKEYEILVGKSKYSQVAKGEAMMESNTFAKAIVEKHTGKILGFHIIGPYAPSLIQEIINIMARKGNYMELADSMHIHPALSELILATFSNLHEV